MSTEFRIARTLIARDTTTFARRIPGKLLVAVTLMGFPTALLLRSVITGSYINDSWMAALAAIVIAITYLMSRRLLVTLVATAVVLAVTAIAIAPRLSTDISGNPALLARVDALRDAGDLEGYRDLLVVTVDRSTADPVQQVHVGLSSTTPVEIGSVTKAMTGLVIADAINRGEVDREAPVSVYLPELAGTPAATVTMHELVTHTAGFPGFGQATIGRGFWASPLGRNFFSTERAALLEEARQDALATRGEYRYSTLGAALAGLAVAAAAGMDYDDLMRVRLFEPLGMHHTAVETESNAAAGGWSASGLAVDPWIMGAYAPGGGVVSTAEDLVTFVTAVLDGSAPGLDAMTPLAAIDDDGTHVATLWHHTTTPSGGATVWHTGQTGGYSTYVGIDRESGTALILLSTVSRPDIAALAHRLSDQHS